MRPLRRFLLVLSILITSTAGGGWARSYWVGNAVTWHRDLRFPSEGRYTSVYVNSSCGGLRCDVYHRRSYGSRYDATAPLAGGVVSGFKFERRHRAYYPYMQIDGPAPAFWWHGIASDANVWSSELAGADVASAMLTLPYWLVFGVLAIVTIVQLMSAFRRLHHRSANQCRACGYDLTGNVSGTCSECGAMIVSSNRTATAE